MLKENEFGGLSTWNLQKHKNIFRSCSFPAVSCKPTRNENIIFMK